MTIPPSVATRLWDAAAKELAQIMREEIADAQLITMQQAADMLGVSKPTVRHLLKDWVDLGVQCPRVSLRDVKQLIDRRRVPA